MALYGRAMIQFENRVALRFRNPEEGEARQIFIEAHGTTRTQMKLINYLSQ